MMFCIGEEKQWNFGKAGVVGLQRMGLLVQEISNPCLYQSPIKVQKMLKPDKWHAIFDSDGKAFGFQKVLKSITLGGIHPSIRPEVWEFLLGCYTLDSTAEYRQQLRAARRQRYKELLMQCQKMHSSVGTGSLAFVVGSKVMDMRTSSRDDRRQNEVTSRKSSLDNNTNKSDNSCRCSETCEGQSYGNLRRRLSQSGDLIRVRKSTDDAVHDSSCLSLTSSPVSCCSTLPVREASISEYMDASSTNFPPLPVTDLFERSSEDIDECHFHDNKHSTEYFHEDNGMHSFQISNNEDLIIESNDYPATKTMCFKNPEIEMVYPDVTERVLNSNASCNKKEILNNLRISDIPETDMLNTITSHREADSDERVSEWLWTLHQIVVDVVRTDNHLEFYEDTRNFARMSDILAVYAWVDPATGYCQGMSDLLSPFVVLFEDNADAFWCFETLLRRMRDNFQMEGPTGVMKQLQALWNILRLTDREMSVHLSHIGAESLHFAFRMLLVLFRRELSFDETLCMWEMMWAADFDESSAHNAEERCLEALAVQLPSETYEDKASFDNSVSERQNLDCCSTTDCAIKSTSTQPFCGLTNNFCPRNTSDLLTKDAVQELPVFCVAAILIMNRFPIIKQTQSFDDMIKIFNDNMLKINVKRCVRMAIKLRKKYIYKMVRSKSPANQTIEA